MHILDWIGGAFIGGGFVIMFHRLIFADVLREEFRDGFVEGLKHERPKTLAASGIDRKLRGGN